MCDSQPNECEPQDDPLLHTFPHMQAEISNAYKKGITSKWVDGGFNFVSDQVDRVVHVPLASNAVDQDGLAKAWFKSNLSILIRDGAMRELRSLAYDTSEARKRNEAMRRSSLRRDRLENDVKDKTLQLGGGNNVSYSQTFPDAYSPNLTPPHRECSYARWLTDAVVCVCRVTRLRS
jgi:hypothetical protein